MKLETFFEKFDLFADAPDAVGKMREVILTLAVQGKLVPQDPNDEPADLLLQRVDSEREQLLISKKTRRHEFLGPVADDAIPFNIPSSWQWRYLADVCFLITDGAHHTPQYLESGVPFLSVKDVSSGIIDFSSTRYISEDAHRELCKRCKPELGDILLTKVGTTGIAVTVDDDREFSIFVSLALLKFSQPNLDRRYLKHLINSPFVRQQSADNTQGIGNKNLVLRLINQFTVPIPPLAEQKRIVAKVDELMALCDQLEAQQEERETRHAALAQASLARFAEAPTPTNLQFLFHKSYTIAPADLRKSILSLAFAGKLVSQDSNDEPAAVLLEKARDEKAQLIEGGLVKKEPWADKLQDPSKLYDLPPGWEWTHVSDVVEKVTVGFVGSMKEQYQNEGVPFLRCQNVRVNRYEPIGLTFISEDFHRSIMKSALRPGDVVVTRSGNVGVTCVVPDSLPEANCSDLVIVKRPLALIPSFLSYFINSIAAGQIKAKTVGIALTHFNTQSVAQMTVALPPLAEQRRIVAKVDELMALVDALETQLASSRATAEKLLAAIVGELTDGKKHHAAAAV